MSKVIEQALAECLERLERDGASIENAVRHYPELRDELEPLLVLAVEMRQLPRVMAPPSLRASKRPVFAPRPGRRPIDLASWLGRLAMPRPAYGWSAPLARLAASLVALVLLMGGTVIASAGSIPDEPLYSVKLAVEGAQLAMAPAPEMRAELEMQFAARRLQEVEAAALREKPEAVERGLVLYEQQVESALRSMQASSSAADDQGSLRLQDSLDQHQQVLARVYSQVPEKAQPAIAHAMEVSSRKRAASSKGNSPEPEMGTAIQPSPTSQPVVRPVPERVAPVRPTPPGRLVAASATIEPSASAGPIDVGPESPGHGSDARADGNESGKDKDTDKDKDTAQGRDKDKGEASGEKERESQGEGRGQKEDRQVPGAARDLPPALQDPGARGSALPARRPLPVTIGLTSTPTATAVPEPATPSHPVTVTPRGGDRPEDRGQGSSPPPASTSGRPNEEKRSDGGDDGRKKNAQDPGLPPSKATGTPEPPAVPTPELDPSATLEPKKKSTPEPRATPPARGR